MEKKVFFYAEDGVKLCSIWTLPKNKTRRAIVLAHGITSDKDEDGVFVKLASQLQQNDFVVLRFDFRGHGESSGKPIDMTIAGELFDIDAAINEVKEKGFSAIGLVGASFGGGIATLYAANNQQLLHALCLWNPCLNYDRCFINPTLPWIRARKGHMKNDLQQKGWTTLGSGKYVLGKPLFDEMAALLPYKEIRKITVPLLVIHGNKDTYVPYEDAKEAVIGMKNAAFITIDGGEHGFHEPEEHTLEACKETLAFFKTNV